MDFRQTESELSGEVEYLAALFAFKDQTLSADDLQLAMARLVSGEFPTILAAIRSLGVVEPVRLAAAIKMAQLYCQVNSPSHPPPRRHRNEFNQTESLPRLQHRSLGDDSDDELEFEDTPERQAAPPAQEFEWQPTSDWASHIYYVEDILRGYTGGRLGIVSTLALCICLGVIVWGVIESKIFEPQTDEVRTERGQQSQTLDLAEVDPFNNPTVSSPALTPTPTPALTSTAPTLNPTPPVDGTQSIGEAPSPDQSGNRTDDNFPTPANSQVPVDEESTDDWLSIPISSLTTTAQPSVEPDAAANSITGKSETDLLDEELMVAMTEIISQDLTSARTRLSRIFEGKGADIDLQRDARWLRTGIGVMLEQDTPESIEAASKWLRLLQADNQPLNHLLFARWLLRTSAPQKVALVEYFASTPPPKSKLNHWLLAASGDHKNAIPALETELTSDSQDPLNHFFLAIAYWVANRPKDVLQQLDQYHEATVSPPVAETELSDSVAAETRWLKDVSMKALDAAAAKLRDRASGVR